MALEIGSEVEGVVTGITHFGAFIKLPDNNTGLVHISEVADAYVKNVRHYLREGDRIIVKIIGVNEEGKYDLSLKQATEKIEAEQLPQEEIKQYQKEDKRGDKPEKLTFEDKLSRFLKQSEERLLDLKRNTESKRKGRGR